jgi:hypothetical protein
MFPSSTGCLVNDGKLLLLIRKALCHAQSMVVERDLRAFQRNAPDFRKRYLEAVSLIAPGLRKKPGLVSGLPGIRSAFELIKRSSVLLLENDINFGAITVPAGAFVPTSDITRLKDESFVMREVYRVLKFLSQNPFGDYPFKDLSLWTVGEGLLNPKVYLELVSSFKEVPKQDDWISLLAEEVDIDAFTLFEEPLRYPAEPWQNAKTYIPTTLPKEGEWRMPDTNGCWTSLLRRAREEEAAALEAELAATGKQLDTATSCEDSSLNTVLPNPSNTDEGVVKSTEASDLNRV